MKLNNPEMVNLWQFSLGDKEKEVLNDIFYTKRIEINDNSISSIPRKIVKIKRTMQENDSNDKMEN